MLLMLCLCISSASCVSDSHTVDHFPIYETDFKTYRDSVRAYLLNHAMPSRSEADTELNLPFELTANPEVAYKGQFLLLHGLNDSAYVWRDYAIELTALGFDVRAILFDGHGSSPEEMLHVKWQSWMSKARNHLKQMQAAGTEIYLGGFSMGAVIATWLALDNPSIAGLFLVSPAYDSKLNHYLRWSGLYARFKPWLFGGMILEDNPIKYNSIPINSGWQYYQLTRGLKRRWKGSDRIEMPALMVMSGDDSVVDVAYTKNLFRSRFTSDRRLLVTYVDGGKSSEGSTPHTNAGFEKIRSSRFMPLRILNQSHQGLMFSSENDLFGKQAKVLVCNGNRYPVFMACMRSSQHWYGAQHTLSPDGVAVARTTYNPDWHAVTQQIEEVFLH